MNVVGARPNFMKIAPIMDEMAKRRRFEITLLHTGQHYDASMSKSFFDDLGIPKPDISLGVGSGNHGEQTGKIMIEFEKVVMREKPDLVIVVGDVNSTIACGLVAVKHGIRLAHVEAGLRSFDRSMPEEINRILTDQIADVLFITEKSAEANLLREGIDKEKVHFVGNVMIDTLMRHLNLAQESTILDDLNVEPQSFSVLTLHRPSNVDSEENFTDIFSALQELQTHLPIVFPVHPRTKKRLGEFGFHKSFAETPHLFVVEPLGYLDFLKLLSEAQFVLTDSGGIQEETTVLGVPCLTIRENTERPVTVEVGTNTIVGCHANRILSESEKILRGQTKKGRRPELWDGKAAQRIVDVLLKLNN